MQTLVAVYPSRAQAEDMKGMLVDCGVPRERIALSPESADGDRPVPAGSRPSGFWDWLLGSDVDDHDRELYSNKLRSGLTAVSVQLPDGKQRDKVQGLLHEHGAVDLSGTRADGNGATGYHVRVYPVERAVQES